MSHPKVSAADKERLRALYRTLDPVVLLAEIRAAQAELGNRIAHRKTPPSANDVNPVLNFATAWQHGEVRATHRRRYVRTKPVPRKPKIFDEVRSDIDDLLHANPTLTAVDLLHEFRSKYPARVDKVSLRTMQRERKLWNECAVKRLIGANALTMPNECKDVQCERI